MGQLLTAPGTESCCSDGSYLNVTSMNNLEMIQAALIGAFVFISGFFSFLVKEVIQSATDVTGVADWILGTGGVAGLALVGIGLLIIWVRLREKKYDEIRKEFQSELKSSRDQASTERDNAIRDAQMWQARYYELLQAKNTQPPSYPTD